MLDFFEMGTRLLLNDIIMKASLYMGPHVGFPFQRNWIPGSLTGGSVSTRGYSRAISKKPSVDNTIYYNIKT
jgi:hypothetical protein